MLLLFASTKFCDFWVPMILRVLIFAISRSRAKFCDFVQLGGSEQKTKGGGDATPIHSVLPGLPQYNSTNGDQICRAFGHIFAY